MKSSLPLVTLATLATALLLSSCAIVTTPIKVAGKVATTSVGVVGKAAGAGIDAMRGGDAEASEE